jgi:hypothetical protein
MGAARATLAVLLAAGPAAAVESAVAAGFSGVYAHSLLLDEADGVQGCRVTAPLGDLRVLKIERRRGGPPTLALSNAPGGEPGGAPRAVRVGARVVAEAGRATGRGRTLTLDDAAVAALTGGAPATLDLGAATLSLPPDGLARAVAFAAGCRFAQAAP